MVLKPLQVLFMVTLTLISHHITKEKIYSNTRSCSKAGCREDYSTFPHRLSKKIRLPIYTYYHAKNTGNIMKNKEYFLSALHPSLFETQTRKLIASFTGHPSGKQEHDTFDSLYQSGVTATGVDAKHGNHLGISYRGGLRLFLATMQYKVPGECIFAKLFVACLMMSIKKKNAFDSLYQSGVTATGVDAKHGNHCHLDVVARQSFIVVKFKDNSFENKNAFGPLYQSGVTATDVDAKHGNHLGISYRGGLRLFLATMQYKVPGECIFAKLFVACLMMSIKKKNAFDSLYQSGVTATGVDAKHGNHCHLDVVARQSFIVVKFKDNSFENKNAFGPLYQSGVTATDVDAKHGNHLGISYRGGLRLFLATMQYKVPGECIFAKLFVACLMMSIKKKNAFDSLYQSGVTATGVDAKHGNHCHLDVVARQSFIVVKFKDNSFENKNAFGPLYQSGVTATDVDAKHGNHLGISYRGGLRLFLATMQYKVPGECIFAKLFVACLMMSIKKKNAFDSLYQSGVTATGVDAKHGNHCHLDVVARQSFIVVKFKDNSFENKNAFGPLYQSGVTATDVDAKHGNHLGISYRGGLRLFLATMQYKVPGECIFAKLFVACLMMSIKKKNAFDSLYQSGVTATGVDAKHGNHCHLDVVARQSFIVVKFKDNSYERKMPSVLFTNQELLQLTLMQSTGITVSF
ncbi:uncharacterized protein EV154DRAFT_485447 [Mucor mucedo]|uniref:uncharacterized protein n=1 Tax=Mucor mucedo TaxID=29922 RepID=UPI00221EBE0A|nr:uncharacterized protein EV154DRAFT_485447 [Mucor mucedo]KAI7884126.1 hypothetical protein EV154DRAFT_485447 [Mucor mucedo]